MNGRLLSGVAAVAVGISFVGTPAFSQKKAPAGGAPGFTLKPSPPEGARDIAPGGLVVQGPPPAGGRRLDYGDTPGCKGSPLCGNRLREARQDTLHLEWDQTMGYLHSYPFDLPAGGGGVPAVAIDSKGNLWVFQRNARGKPALFEYSPDNKLIRTVGEDVIGHQEKAHGTAVDAEDNVWICDANGATVMKISPEGKLLLTLGVKGQRGDWVEAKGQRLLWQPMQVAFGPTGDVFIGEGHANESPNDVGASPTNTIGAARVIRLDKNGKYLNQWYGNSGGPGKFDAVHGIAVDPRTGNVWIGDREQYRLVVYSPDGKFVQTVQMKNLTCAVQFDPQGNLWVATGHDGQVLKVDQDGNVQGAVGSGSGFGAGQFVESSYTVWDKQGNMYVADTGLGRVTKFSLKK